MTTIIPPAINLNTQHKWKLKKKNRERKTEKKKKKKLNELQRPMRCWKKHTHKAREKWMFFWIIRRSWQRWPRFARYERTLHFHWVNITTHTKKRQERKYICIEICMVVFFPNSFRCCCWCLRWERLYCGAKPWKTKINSNMQWIVSSFWFWLQHTPKDTEDMIVIHDDSNDFRLLLEAKCEAVAGEWNLF